MALSDTISESLNNLDQALQYIRETEMYDDEICNQTIASYAGLLRVRIILDTYPGYEPTLTDTDGRRRPIGSYTDSELIDCFLALRSASR